MRFASSAAFLRETRIGIGTDAVAGTANESQLYAGSHVRPMEVGSGSRRVFSLGVQLDCQKGQLPSSILSTFALGGKGRVATVSSVGSAQFVAGNAQPDLDKWDFDGRRQELLLRLIAVVTPIPVCEGGSPFGLGGLASAAAGRVQASRGGDLPAAHDRTVALERRAKAPARIPGRQHVVRPLTFERRAQEGLDLQCLEGGVRATPGAARSGGTRLWCFRCQKQLAAANRFRRKRK